MRVTIIKDDNMVVVNGEARAVDCSALPADFHALQWDDVRGEVEYAPYRADGTLHKKPNAAITDFTPYKTYLDKWTTAVRDAAG